MRAMAIAIAISTVACTEPAIEMSLVLPPDTASPFDLSCVTAVDLVPLALEDRELLDIGDRSVEDDIPCVELDAPASSLQAAAAALRGKFEMAIPSDGVAAVMLRGRAGRCDKRGSYYESIFHGAGMYTAGADSLPIRVARNLSCDAIAPRTVRPIDLFALVRTRQCTAPTDGMVFTGNVRPTLLEGAFPNVLLESGSDFDEPGAAGTATVQMFTRSFAGTCPAVGWASGTASGSTCVNEDALGVARACAKAGEIELPVVAGNDAFAHLDRSVLAAHSTLVFGAVWSSAGTPGPVAGATIAASSSGIIQYLDVDATSIIPAANATATRASGAFVLHADGVTELTVSAPGKPSRRVWVGSGYDFPGTALIVLD